MNTTLRAYLFSTVILLFSCKQNANKTAAENTNTTNATVEKNQLSQAEVLVADAIQAHGGNRYDTATYSFTFRDKNYRFQNTKNSFRYSVKSNKDSNRISDVLENGSLTRTINDTPVLLSEKDNAKYTEALNSVIYFATLPHKLKDKAVQKKYEGKSAIKGQNYDLLGVSFKEEGGGKDYDDKFMYWINVDTKTVDYLAYSYSTNDGGVRFRSAFNPRNVNGIRFQDYINYEVPVGTPLKEIALLYEKGNLRELSKIITEDVAKIQKN